MSLKFTGLAALIGRPFLPVYYCYVLIFELFRLALPDSIESDSDSLTYDSELNSMSFSLIIELLSSDSEFASTMLDVSR